MTTLTVRELITNALTISGVYQSGEAPTASDMSAAKIALTNLEDSWSNEELLVFSLKESVFPIVAGQASYELGEALGADWSMKRPMSIATMKTRQFPGGQQQQDLPIMQLTPKQWASFIVKLSTSTLPLYFYDDRNYPNRKITFWPVPQVNMEIIMWTYQPLLELDNLDAPVHFPPGYQRAFTYALAAEICPIFGKQVSPEILGIANAAIDKLKQQNAITPTYQFDSGLNGRRGTGLPFEWYKAGGFLF
jgi:hypothetical protein